VSCCSLAVNRQSAPLLLCAGRHVGKNNCRIVRKFKIRIAQDGRTSCSQPGTIGSSDLTKKSEYILWMRVKKDTDKYRIRQKVLDPTHMIVLDSRVVQANGHIFLPTIPMTIPILYPYVTRIARPCNKPFTAISHPPYAALLAPKILFALIIIKTNVLCGTRP
jgi:hypothetical protein